MGAGYGERRLRDWRARRFQSRGQVVSPLRFHEIRVDIGESAQGLEILVIGGVRDVQHDSRVVRVRAADSEYAVNDMQRARGILGMGPQAQRAGDEGVCADHRAGGRVGVVEQQADPLLLARVDAAVERGVQQRQLQAGGIGVLPGLAYRLCRFCGGRIFCAQRRDDGIQCCLVLDDWRGGVVGRRG